MFSFPFSIRCDNILSVARMAIVIYNILTKSRVFAFRKTVRCVVFSSFQKSATAKIKFIRPNNLDRKPRLAL